MSSMISPIPSQEVSPVADTASGVYYKMMLSGLSFGELWRMTPRWGFPIIAFQKLFGKDRSISQGIPGPRVLPGNIVEKAAVPAALAGPLEDLVSSAASAGFIDPIYYAESQSLMPGFRSISAMCRHPEGETIAVLSVVHGQPASLHLEAYLSGYTDGSFFCTTNDRPVLNYSPSKTVQYRPGQTGLSLLTEHEQARSHWAQSREVCVVRTRAEAADLLAKSALDSDRWNRERGLYVQMTDREVATARQSLLRPRQCHVDVSTRAPIESSRTQRQTVRTKGAPTSQPSGNALGPHPQTGSKVCRTGTRRLPEAKVATVAWHQSERR